ncbi:XRE family transcriptional regulator [Lachnospiraceae bacterium OF09-33XD]|jgi:DNA-binding XRE family transcriptional regulator|nr:XRE family transcriptional regulator [Lachnospiraceae bacterium OF09-33XD]
MTRISLEAARVNAKLTQKELAEILGISNATVVNWEKGNTEPNITQLRKISELSGIPMDFIFIPEKFNKIE